MSANRPCQEVLLDPRLLLRGCARRTELVRLQWLFPRMHRVLELSHSLIIYYGPCPARRRVSQPYVSLSAAWSDQSYTIDTPNPNKNLTSAGSVYQLSSPLSSFIGGVAWRGAARRDVTWRGVWRGRLLIHFQVRLFSFSVQGQSPWSWRGAARRVLCRAGQRRAEPAPAGRSMRHNIRAESP